MKRNLASFNKIVGQGSDVVLSQKGSFIKDQKSGKVINLNKDTGTPTWDVWVPASTKYKVLNLDKQDYSRDKRTCNPFGKDQDMTALQRECTFESACRKTAER